MRVGLNFGPSLEVKECPACLLDHPAQYVQPVVPASSVVWFNCPTTGQPVYFLLRAVTS